MQDEIRDKSVTLVIHVGKDGGKLTAELLAWAIRQYQKQGTKQPHGKQSVKSRVRQGAGVQNLEITDKNIKSFERIARKYGVDYALKKDLNQGRYLVFFKARDADALHAAFVEYTAKTLTPRKDKPSLRKQLAQFKELVQELGAGKEKMREKGGMER